MGIDERANKPEGMLEDGCFVCLLFFSSFFSRTFNNSKRIETTSNPVADESQCGRPRATAPKVWWAPAELEREVDHCETGRSQDTVRGGTSLSFAEVYVYVWDGILVCCLD